MGKYDPLYLPKSFWPIDRAHTLTEHNTMIQNINLSVQTTTQLDNLICNRARHGDVVGAREAAIERIGRGRYKPHHLVHLNWTAKEADALLAPFAALSDQARKNKRTPGVLTGGRCRRSWQNPEHLWIDRYVGLTVSNFNAAIACHINVPGNEPVLVLVLKINGIEHIKQYSIHRSATVLQIWAKLCQKAERNIVLH